MLLAEALSCHQHCSLERRRQWLWRPSGSCSRALAPIVPRLVQDSDFGKLAGLQGSLWFVVDDSGGGRAVSTPRLVSQISGQRVHTSPQSATRRGWASCARHATCMQEHGLDQ